MSSWGGILVAAAMLLVASGAAKSLRPEGTQRSLRTVGLPSSRLVVTALGATEIVVGATALVYPGGPAAAAVALLYVGFAGYIAYVKSSDAAAGCGCFGVETDDPPGWLHLAVVLLAAGAAALAIPDDAALVDLVVDDPVVGLVTALVGAVLAGLTAAALTVLPEVAGAASTLRGRRTADDRP